MSFTYDIWISSSDCSWSDRSYLIFKLEWCTCDAFTWRPNGSGSCQEAICSICFENAKVLSPGVVQEPWGALNELSEASSWLFISDWRVEIVATSNLYEKFDFWPNSSTALLRLNFWKPNMFLPKLLCAKIKSNNHKKNKIGKVRQRNAIQG